MTQSTAAPRLRVLSTATIAAALLALLMVLAGRADAATYTVSSNGNAASADFVAAVAQANANPGADTILFTGTLPTIKPDTKINVTQDLTVNSPAGPGVKFDGTTVVIPMQGAPIIEVAFGAKLTLINSTFTNGGTAGVPAIDVLGTIDVQNSTLAGNIGPAVTVESGAVGTFTNSTLSDGTDFGLIDVGTATLMNSTVVSNANGGIDNVGATLTMKNTIIANNGFANCTAVPAAGSVTSSLSNSAGCGATVSPAINLGLLKASGGPTSVHPLKAGSAAINAGNNATCTLKDQRYATRDAQCDIGADEFNAVAPVLTQGNITTTATSSANSAAVTYANPFTSANDVIVSQSCTPASGSTFTAAGSPATVNCTATDGHGNTGTGSFTVTVTNPAPVITQPSNVGPIEATSAAGATVSYPAVATTDANDGPGTATCTPASGSVFAIGVTTVTCTKSDPGGATATPKTFTVTVRDTTKPVIAPIADKVVDSQSTAGAAVTFTPSVTDAVGGGSTTCVPASGSTFPLGNTTVTCNAVDGAGNAAAPVSFQVRVVNVIALTPATATNPINTPHTVTATVIKAGAPVSGLTITFTVTAGPNTGKTGTGTTNASGQATYTYTGTGGAGTDTIRASFTDTAGTQATTATKTWIANLPPVAKLTASPTSGPATLTVTFNGSQSSDPEGPLASYTLDYGDGSPVASGTGAPPAALNHGYSAAGSYTATLTVKDAGGLTASATVPVTVTKPATTLAVTPGLLRFSPFGLFLGDLHATLYRASPATPVAGKTIVFSTGGAYVCAAVTDAAGNATCGGVANFLSVLLGGGYTAAYAGDAQYVGSAGFAALIG